MRKTARAECSHDSPRYKVPIEILKIVAKFIIPLRYQKIGNPDFTSNMNSPPRTETGILRGPRDFLSVRVHFHDIKQRTSLLRQPFCAIR